MGIVMGVMAVFMVVGFLGFGHHLGMTGGHGKEGHKNEAIIQDRDKEAPFQDCPVTDERKNGNAEKKWNLKNEEGTV